MIVDKIDYNNKVVHVELSFEEIQRISLEVLDPELFEQLVRLRRSIGDG